MNINESGVHRVSGSVVAVMSLQICRICFATSGQLYALAKYKSLERAYNTLTGFSAARGARGAREVRAACVCAACAVRLRRCARFRAHVLRAHATFLRLLSAPARGQITLESIKSSIGIGYRSDHLDGENGVSVNIDNNTNNDVKLERDPLQLDMERYEEATTNYVDICLSEYSDRHSDVRVETDDVARDRDEWRSTCSHDVEEEGMCTDQNWDTCSENGDWGYGEDHSATGSRVALKKQERAMARAVRKVTETLEAGNGCKLLPDTNTLSCELCTCQTVRVDQSFDNVKADNAIKSVNCKKCVSVKNENNKTRPHLCHICMKSFRNRIILVTHLRTHSGEKPYSCDVCGKVFSQKGHLRNHLRIHSGEKPYSCVICNKSFGEKGHLRNHSRIHSGEKPYTCDRCNKSFTRNDSLKIHITKEHSGDKPFSCNICPKAFYKKEKLRNHIRIHSGEKPYECSICKREFSEKSNLQKHLRIHTGEKPYTCNVCQKSFRQKSVLITHLRTHSREKPYTCNICEKAFSVKSHLGRHSRTHSGEKPHSCNVCKKAFSVKDTLQKHLRTHSCTSC